MTETVADIKKSIRTRVRSARRALPEDEVSARGHSLCEQLISVVEVFGARSVACFYPTANEPDTRPFLNWALENGVEVLLPKSREDGLLDWVPFSAAGMLPGMFGILEPVGDPLSPLAVSEVDVMFIPASAVDSSGNRLGWGRGFYDKSLGSMEAGPPTFAIVYDEEVLDEVPTELHDAPVSGAVTQSRIYRFND